MRQQSTRAGYSVTWYCVRKALRISAVDLVLRQSRVVAEAGRSGGRRDSVSTGKAAKGGSGQPRLLATPRDADVADGERDHGDDAAPDMSTARWNSPGEPQSKVITPARHSGPETGEGSQDSGHVSTSSVVK